MVLALPPLYSLSGLLQIMSLSPSTILHYSPVHLSLWQTLSSRASFLNYCNLLPVSKWLISVLSPLSAHCTLLSTSVLSWCFNYLIKICNSFTDLISEDPAQVILDPAQVLKISVKNPASTHGSSSSITLNHQKVLSFHRSFFFLPFMLGTVS